MGGREERRAEDIRASRSTGAEGKYQHEVLAEIEKGKRGTVVDVESANESVAGANSAQAKQARQQTVQKPPLSPFNPALLTFDTDSARDTERSVLMTAFGEWGSQTHTQHGRTRCC